ncbi:MAG: serpin family protein [Melioribacteraceae bacterium]|nr:serpin family protein [Melioribacteraceae bacterium]
MKKLIMSLIIGSLLILITACGQDSSSGSLKVSKNVEFEENDFEKIISANNKLALDLLPNLKENENGNIFISPTSLFMALSMVYNGSDATTKEEIAKVLNSEGIDIEEMNEANASLLSKLHNESEEIELDLANSIWLNESFHFQEEFAQNNRDYFNAEITEINILDNKSVDLINKWVSDSTNNKIDEMVKAPLDPDLVALIINAVYFKGDWKYKFNENETVEKSFYLEDGTTKTIPLMSLNKELSYMENDHFQAVSLPYGEGDMSMNVFLPRENSTIEEFEKTLTIENLEKWNSEFIPTEGTVRLPKFKMEYEMVLNEPLKTLGMTSAFEKYANFSKMIQEDDPIWISKVVQKTFIDVNEKGSEAAAATKVEIVEESAPANSYEMEVNRPFFITITHHETGAILFMGSIADPSKGK